MADEASGPQPSSNGPPPAPEIQPSAGASGAGDSGSKAAEESAAAEEQVEEIQRAPAHSHGGCGCHGHGPHGHGHDGIPQYGGKGGIPSSLESALAALTMGRLGEDTKRHTFWETQPVEQYKDKRIPDLPEGPIEPPSPLESVRKEPYNLPSQYEWCTCNMDDSTEMREVYTLLTNNYVEDDDNMFRFDYSQPFLKWALQPPGYAREWHIGVRAKTGTKKLVAFITGVPAVVSLRGKHVKVAEINFLCVHKKLRSKRLAPVLIKEVTRRVHLTDIWQAVYTAGVQLPTPVTTAQYWHRSLNPKKLIEVGFSRLAPRMTMSRTIKLYKLPDAPLTPGLRPMERRDIVPVTRMLGKYLEQFAVAPVLTETDVEHTLLPVPDVVESFVVENRETHELTDFISFYTLPSTIIGNAHHSKLKAAYSFYNVANSTPLLALMNDALILARQRDYDVFNALDIMQNEEFLKELKFGPGDGHLHYYLYNYRLHGPMKPSELGLVLL